jgi:DNA-binding response OmpR family regulator
MSIGAPPEELALFGTLKVLVVDDSAEMRRLLLALLAAMNIGEVVCAQSGEAGLKLFAAERPDLIITDGAMQPMDGYEMTRRIRADTANADVPILMISGHIGHRHVVQARNDGITDYLAKPVTPALLYERVRAAVSRPIHIVETQDYRGLSPARRLTPHMARE